MAKVERTHQAVSTDYLEGAVEGGFAHLYGDYQSARRECRIFNTLGKRTGMFSFVVFADEQFAVISIPVINRED